MYLDINSTYKIERYEPDDATIPIDVVIRHHVGDGVGDGYDEFGNTSYPIGRLLADSLDIYDAADWRTHHLDAADAADSLQPMIFDIFDGNGNVKEHNGDSLLEGFGTPSIAIYRFALHDDYAQCKLAVLDCFCRTFGSDAAISINLRTIDISSDDLKTIGFDNIFEPKKRGYLVRENMHRTNYLPKDFPDMDALPAATPKHKEWVESLPYKSFVSRHNLTNPLF